MSNEIEVKSNTGLAMQQNSWINGEQDREDLIFPRAKIFQATGSEFEQYPDAKPGQIINHLTGEVLPDTFIPFLRFKNFGKFNPRDTKDPNFDNTKAPGAIIWMTNDANDPRVQECKFGSNGEHPTAIEFMNFMCIFSGCSFPVIVAFSKMSMKAGKKLYSMLAFSDGKLNRQYKLTTKKVTNDKGTFYIYDVNPAGLASEDDAEFALSLKRQFATKVADIKVENDEVKWSE